MKLHQYNFSRSSRIQQTTHYTRSSLPYNQFVSFIHRLIHTHTHMIRTLEMSNWMSLYFLSHFHHQHHQHATLIVLVDSRGNARWTYIKYTTGCIYRNGEMEYSLRLAHSWMPMVIPTGVVSPIRLFYYKWPCFQTGKERLSSLCVFVCVYFLSWYAFD